MHNASNVGHGCDSGSPVVLDMGPPERKRYEPESLRERLARHPDVPSAAAGSIEVGGSGDLVRRQGGHGPIRDSVSWGATTTK